MVGSEYRVNSAYVSGSQDRPVAVALDDGGYAISWTSYDQDGSSEGIYAQYFTETGNPVSFSSALSSPVSVPGVTIVSSSSRVGSAIDGGAGNDQIYGSKGADVLSGGEGDDTLVGGKGDDVAVFRGDSEDYTIDLANAQVTDTNTLDGDEGTDTLSGMESIQFGDGSEVSVSTSERQEFSVNTFTDHSQQYPTVSGLTDGGYVIAWQSPYQDESTSGNYGIFAQRYDAGGNALGAEFPVNTWVQNNQTNPAVTTLENGNFLVTWQDYSGSSHPDGGSNWDVRGRLFDGAGNGLGDEFTVNSYTSSSQYDPSIAALEGGGFAITWQDDSGHSGGSSSDIRVQLFDAAGGSVGSEQLVNSYVGDVQNHPTVTGLAGGGYVVAYRDNAGSSRSDDDVTGKDDDIWAQIYNSDGSKAGAEFRMNATVTEDQQYPTITGLNNGGFAAAWESYNQDGQYDGIAGQVFDAHGSPLSSQDFVINSQTSGYQYTPSMTTLSDGQFLVTWYDSHYGDIKAQRYGADGTPNGGEFTGNSETYGTQSAPKVAAWPTAGLPSPGIPIMPTTATTITPVSGHANLTATAMR